MKKTRFFISLVIAASLIFGLLSCNNIISDGMMNDSEKSDGFGKVSATIFIPDYQKMAESSRVIAPQTKKARFSYKKDK